MNFIFEAIILFSVVYIALESRRTSMLLIDIMKDQRRVKEFLLGQFCVQVHTYNALRLENLESEIRNQSNAMDKELKERMEKTISEIKREISILSSKCYELETKEEIEYRRMMMLKEIE